MKSFVNIIYTLNLASRAFPKAKNSVVCSELPGFEIPFIPIENLVLPINLH